MELNRSIRGLSFFQPLLLHPQVLIIFFNVSPSLNLRSEFQDRWGVVGFQETTCGPMKNPLHSSSGTGVFFLPSKKCLFTVAVREGPYHKTVPRNDMLFSTILMISWKCCPTILKLELSLWTLPRALCEQIYSHSFMPTTWYSWCSYVSILILQETFG